MRESNGRLRGRVHVNGRTEVHSEGVCYLEWREDGRRLREAIPNHAEVLERARLKLIKLDAQGERRAQYDPRPRVPSIFAVFRQRREWRSQTELCDQDESDVPSGGSEGTISGLRS